MTIVETLMEKLSFFITELEGSNEVLINILLIFLNKRNITTSFLMIHLNCIVVHYANLNSSSISKPYLGVVEYAISFFLILIYVYFNI